MRLNELIDRTPTVAPRAGEASCEGDNKDRETKVRGAFDKTNMNINIDNNANRKTMGYPRTG